MSSCGWSPMSPDQIRAWLARHPEALPRTLNELARFPMTFRRVMMKEVTPETRLSLWCEHLESLLAPESTLNERQRQLVATTIPRLPELFAAPAPNPVIIEWEREISGAFSRQEASRAFQMIGPPEPSEGIPLPPDALPSTAV